MVSVDVKPRVSDADQFHEYTLNIRRLKRFFDNLGGGGATKSLSHKHIDTHICASAHTEAAHASTFTHAAHIHLQHTYTYSQGTSSTHF